MSINHDHDDGVYNDNWTDEGGDGDGTKDYDIMRNLLLACILFYFWLGCHRMGTTSSQRMPYERGRLVMGVNPVVSFYPPNYKQTYKICKILFRS